MFVLVTSSPVLCTPSKHLPGPKLVIAASCKVTGADMNNVIYHFKTKHFLVLFVFYFSLFFLILTNSWHLNSNHFADTIKRPESQSSYFTQDHMKCFSEMLMILFSFATKIISHLTSKTCGTGEFEGSVGSLYRWKLAWADAKGHLCVRVNGNWVFTSSNQNHFTDW